MQFKSFCKLNLFLEVLNKREDGYHNINTLFQTVNLHDTLTFEEIDHDNSFELKCNIKDLNNQYNLLWKAIEKLKPYFPKDRKGIRISLNKKIPVGAGLGGGSSNAATALVGLNNYYQLNLSYDALIELASQIGADVPFFIKGGLARGEGIGDRLTLYDEIFCPLDFVIIYPNVNASTKEAYEGLTLRLKSADRKNKTLDELIYSLKKKDIDKISHLIYNQFEDTQFKKYPVLNQIKKNLLKEGARGALMSGSGSSLFGLFESKKLAKKAMCNMKHLNYKFYLAETVPQSKSYTI